MKTVKETVRKYYKYDTENPIYNLVEVGTLTKNNGVISGFSTNNYASTGSQFSPTSGDTWEFQIKFLATSLSGYQTLCSGRTQAASNGILMGFSNSTLTLTIGNGGWIFSQNAQTSFSANTWYWLKIVFTGSSYILYSSTTGAFNGEEITEISYSSTAQMVSNNNFVFGIDLGNSGASYTPATYCSIDFPESYIKIDNEMWWQGITYPIIDGTSSDYDFYKDVDVYKTSKETIRNYYYSLEYTDAGTYTLNIPETGNYEIEMYGAGGGACGAMHTPPGAGYNVYGTSSGGSGAGFKGNVTLEAGTYTVTVGAYGANGVFKGSSGATSASSGTATILQGIIEAGGGSGATANNGSSGTPGSGGTLSILDNSKIVSYVISSDGNNGQFKNVAGLSGFIANCPGGLSLYDNSQTGYGAGGGKIESNPAYNAQDGYFKISSSQKPVHYEDVDEYKAVKF